MSTLKKLTVQMGKKVVGTLAETPQHEIYFEYSPDWIQTGFSLSPYFLPLTPELKRERSLIFSGLFGIFDDSLPDDWGLLLMDRFFRTKGIVPESLSPLDRLAYIGNQGIGALSYEPASEADEAMGEPMNLKLIAEQAERIGAGSPEEALPALRVAGGSLGGSRPKVFVAFNPLSGKMKPGRLTLEAGYEHWLVKFRSKDDPTDAGSIEAAYADMAAAAGVIMPPTRLFETKAGRFFGVKRFDRSPDGARIHTHTFGGMIHSHFRHPNRDYEEFLSVTFQVTRNFSQVEQAFRRAVFNVLAHNRDDHVKNHAFVADSKGAWSLSPAYDITDSTGVAGQHNMTVAGNRNPGIKELQLLAKKAGIQPSNAAAIIATVSDSIRRWPEFAEKNGVSRLSQQAVAAAHGAKD